MRTNTKTLPSAVKTHGGAPGATLTSLAELERTVAACLLSEDMFYEKGSDVATRITSLCEQVPPADLAALAVKARTAYKLRHVPLFLLRQMARLHQGRLVGDTIAEVIQRPDELSEFLALYWKEKRQPLSAQVKRGLAKAFQRFNEYQLSKWDKDDRAVKLRDVLFMSHAKPLDREQAALWKKLVDKTLSPPDTWEVVLSASKDKRASWERLLRDKVLGDMALLMNLRNLVDAGVDRDLVLAALEARKFTRILPFRFIAAAQYAPEYEAALESAMLRAFAGQEKTLKGRSLLVLDVSGSMQSPLSAKSKMSRVDAACGLAMLLREVAEDSVIYATAGDDGRRVHSTSLVPARRGFALRDAVMKAMSSLGGGGIFLVQCMDFIAGREPEQFERVIVLTDEQDCGVGGVASAYRAKRLGAHNYVLNVAGYQPGLDVRKGWLRFSGWSEHSLDWIAAHETLETQRVG